MAITRDELKSIANVIRGGLERTTDRLLDLMAGIERVLSDQRDQLKRLERAHDARLTELERAVATGEALRDLERRLGVLEQQGKNANGLDGNTTH